MGKHGDEDLVGRFQWRLLIAIIIALVIVVFYPRQSAVEYDDSDFTPQQISITVADSQ